MSLSIQTSPAKQQAHDPAVVSSSPDESSRSWVVYKATSPSGKVYVGITSHEVGARRIEHCYLARSGSKRRTTTNPTAPKAVVRSDGRRYRTMGKAAEDLGVSPSTMTYALKHGSAVQGFTFTRADHCAD